MISYKRPDIIAMDGVPADRPKVKLIKHYDDSRRKTPKKIVHTTHVWSYFPCQNMLEHV
jgi:hypothetical protein